MNLLLTLRIHFVVYALYIQSIDDTHTRTNLPKAFYSFFVITIRINPYSLRSAYVRTYAVLSVNQSYLTRIHTHSFQFRIADTNERLFNV